MSTEEERQIRAREIEARLSSENKNEEAQAQITQAVLDAITDMTSPAVLRLRSFIKAAASPDNSNSVMQSWAKTWLLATDGLVTEARKLQGQAVVTEILDDE